LYETLGICPFGFKCRFSSGHIEKCAEGEGFQGSGLKLKRDTVKLRQVTPANLTSDEERLEWASTTRGEWNVVTPEHISILRKKKVEDLPYTSAYLHSIGEPLDTRPNGGRGNQRSRGGKRGGGKEHDRNGQNAALEDASTKESAVPDTDTGITKSDTILRPVEKKRLNFEGKLYLAPLTTVGNLPFRRLCVKYGADITCGEMGLAQEFLTGNKNEWSLVRRHPSEKCFGVQLCGNRPQTLVAATEHLKAEAPELDFIDINTGCPIDLVVKKGAGSALLDQGSKLGKILRGMSLAAQETPVTIKMRTGIKTGVNTTHKMMPRAVKEWGVGALTVGIIRLVLCLEYLHAADLSLSLLSDTWTYATAAIYQDSRLWLYKNMRGGIAADKR
jgi:tRNA-dihydrouridine synthase 3